jgi:predicted N-acetyltransferase YhbS
MVCGMTTAFAPTARPATAVRPGSPDDAPAAGDIAFRAFSSIADRHGFPPDFPNVEAGVGLVSMLLSHPGFYSAIAEEDGEIVGSNFLDERSPIRGVGPLTVDPDAQNAGVGRLLMDAVLSRAGQSGAPGVRLVQAAYHARSLALYSSLGFEVREPLVVLQGPPVAAQISGRTVRAATLGDIGAANALAASVLGYDRGGELADAVVQGSATVVEHQGRVTGYTTGVAFFGHTVGRTDDDVKALVASAPEFAGPGFLLPGRNTELLRWALGNGLRIVQTMTLMSVGDYSEPQGAYLPSVLY